MIVLLRRFFILLTTLLAVGGKIHFNLPSENTIIKDTLVFIVDNMGYQSSSCFHVSYSSISDSSAGKQTSIINEFLLEKPKLLVSVDDIGEFVERKTDDGRKFTLLLIDSLVAFAKLDPILKVRQYDTSGKHLIFISQKFEEHSIMEMLKKIFEKFFHHYIVNVGVIVRNGTTGFLDFYTYFPVSPGYCFQVIPVLQHRFNSTRPKTGELNLFPRKLDNFFGCPLKVVTFPFAPHIFLSHKNGEIQASGIDIKILYGLAEKLNFEVSIIDAKERGVQNPDGSLTGALKILYDSEANITIGGFGSASRAMILFTASIAYINTAMVFAIPPLQEYSPLERLLLPFDLYVWVAIGLTFGLTFLVAIVLSVWNKSYRDLIFGSTVRHPVFEMVVVYLGGSVVRFPQGGIARNIILQWLIVSLVLSSCYKAILFGMLKTGFLKKFPSTVEGMLDVGFQIDVPINLIQNLKDGPLGGRHSAFHLLQHSIHTHYAILQEGKSKRMVIDTEIQLQHFNSIYYESGILNSLPQRLFIFPMYVYCRKESFLIEPIDDVLTMFIQSGLITFWQDSVLNVSHLKQTQISEATNPLIVDNFQGCFALCGVLILCSTVIFVLEVMSPRINFIQRILIFMKRLTNKCK